MPKWSKFFVLVGLLAVLLATLGMGIYFEHYFVVFLFSVWMAVETFLWKSSGGWKVFDRPRRSRFRNLVSLINIYGKYDTVSETIIEQKIAELKREGALSEAESRWLWRLRDLLELRGLLFGSWAKGKRELKQGFAFSLAERSPQSEEEPDRFSEPPSRQDIIESATLVADLYWKLYDSASGEYPDLSVIARDLYQRIFNHEFDPNQSRYTIEKITDAMQRDEGMPFLIMNLLRGSRGKFARSIAQGLLQNETELDSEVISPLYWISEIHWFSNQKESPITDFETTIRYLYHLCFTGPERAGFLEVDSQFFSQFAVVNEIAREGFQFKEGLVDRVMQLWRTEEGYFDSVFRSVLEAMTQTTSKIYDDRSSWEIFWKRNQEDFCRDDLYVVEGNLSFADKSFKDALNYYEKALAINPRHRAARLNSLFCYVHLGMKERHSLLGQTLVRDQSMLPSAYYVVGNSFILAGDLKQAESYYQELSKLSGWERKIDYYKSTFCYENGLFELALKFAQKAKEKNPSDSTMSFHLSLCFNAIGNKAQALDMVREVDCAPGWLNYYRFTLERDSGKEQEAIETLLQIPPDYFDDPEELAAAVEFAKQRQDLRLLRHLRRKA